MRLVYGEGVSVGLNFKDRVHFRVLTLGVLFPPGAAVRPHGPLLVTWRSCLFPWRFMGTLRSPQDRATEKSMASRVGFGALPYDL